MANKSESQIRPEEAVEKIKGRTSIIVAIIGLIGLVVAPIILKYMKTTEDIFPTSIPCSNGFFDCVFPQGFEGKTYEYKSDTNLELDVDEQAEECGFTTEFGVKITYSVLKPNSNGAWIIGWTDTGDYFNAEMFTAFSFAVKGESGGETFLIGMKDSNRTELTVLSKDYVTVSASKWIKVTIPFNKFVFRGKSINPSALENVSFSFDERNDSGTICIDDIEFSQ